VSDLVAAEWLKLRTTRILLVTAPTAVVLSLTAVAGMVLAKQGGELESTEGLHQVFSVTGAGAIVMLLTGIVVSAGEFRHGTAADTFLTTPRRDRVLAAKLAIGAVVGAAVGLTTSVAAIGLAAVVYPPRAATLPAGSADVLLAVPATVAYAVLFAVIGVAVGALVRDQVVAVAAALAWIAIVEHVLVTLVTSIGRWLPVGAGQAVLRTPLEDLLGPVTGGLVLLAYAAGFSIVAVILEGRRDV
jgi:ABC-2 type transport system permease protein